MKVYLKLKKAEEESEQPVKCKSCIWGQWAGTKQFCSKPVCVKKG